MLAYGYGFPETRERLGRLGDDLEVISAMLISDRNLHLRFNGQYSKVRNAIDAPKPIQRPGCPIMVGGDGPNVTWPARLADELNLDGLSPDEVGETRCRRSAHAAK